MKICLPKMRNVSLMISMLASTGLLAGCAGLQHQVALDPVGPAPSQTAANTIAGQGSLIVFSAPDVRQEVSFENTYFASYSSYKILSPEGKLFKNVANNSETFVAHPQEVGLPAGKYTVVAESRDFGRVTVSLDGDKFWSHLLGLNKSNTVQLPSGEIVGWRAASATP
jgi:hypothetical protein